MPGSTPHGEAWGALARTHAAVARACRRRSPQADFPPLPWYEVLATVAEAPTSGCGWATSPRPW